MALLEAKQLTFHYPDQETAALVNVSFSVQPGEFIAISGPSGSGKSTLLQLLKPEIAPHGRKRGDIIVQDVQANELKPKQLAALIGMVFQDPENQLVMDSVIEELVFGLENLGCDTATMRKRVAEIVHFFGLEPLLDTRTHQLSGGQQQTVNLASVLMMEPKLLLLDEPTAQLDPVAAKDFLHMLRRMNEELGIAVIIVEHRLEDVWPLADRVMVLDQGQIRHFGRTREVAKAVALEASKRFKDYLPAASALYATFSKHDQQSLPITVKEGREWVAKLDVTQRRRPQSLEDSPFQTQRKKLIDVRHGDFQYERGGKRILNDLNLTVYEGERLAIVGGNGTGKSTLLKIMAGLLHLTRGRVLYEGRAMRKHSPDWIGFLPQNPKLFFLEETIDKEMAAALKHQNKDLREEMLERFGLTHLRGRHPYDLSGGERQKAALACLLLREPRLILIDEPTKGLDPVSKKQFGDLLKRLNASGLTIVLVSHDVEFTARYASRCAMLFRGEVTVTKDPDAFFKGNTFYTTAANRITRGGSVPEVLTVEEATRTWRVHD
ncbi:ABC transporter ATP-binding protein [Camelliibacillus cellulosilyticus]|uniref:ABC transporter ATP-binding protein n=1 Tax=Camelliibacillus cellulosilyticus TaxID=2174486 RepID=A0ABV9GGZ7_9BACL